MTFVNSSDAADRTNGAEGHGGPMDSLAGLLA